MATAPPDVTELLARAAGDPTASAAAYTALYAELRRIAAAQMARERAGHTLTPTALVHEAWMRLGGTAPRTANNRQHFLAIATIAMRRILVDHARAALRDKRGAGVTPVTLVTELPQAGTDPAELLALDDALTRLAERDAAMARVVELRWFGGLDIDETAAVLALSPRTVNRHWTGARAWLARELGR
jgi:RNA polymerase sigma factor (TIGR02999 family)